MPTISLKNIENDELRKRCFVSFSRIVDVRASELPKNWIIRQAARHSAFPYRSSASPCISGIMPRDASGSQWDDIL
jgi:hypothetical protein